MTAIQQQPIAIVTGASNARGIAAATCRKLAEQSIDIFFTYWQSEPYWPAVFEQEIAHHGVRCASMELDLSHVDAHTILLDRVSGQLGYPTILINCAAHSVDSNYQDLTAKTLDDHYYTNVRATSMLCVEFARRYERLNLSSGRIINLTSGQGLGPMPGNLAYAVSKAAISAFSESLSAELAHLGITVNAVNPGPTDTNWMTDEIRTHILAKSPMGRIGQPKDAACVIAFLASEDARWITGQVIHSEGGFYRG